MSNSKGHFWGTSNKSASSVIDFDFEKCVKFDKEFLGKMHGKNIKKGTILKQSLKKRIGMLSANWRNQVLKEGATR